MSLQSDVLDAEDSEAEINIELLQKLLLKHLLFSGRQHIQTLARAVALSVDRVEAALKMLYRMGMLDCQESCPSGYPALVFPGLSEKGRNRAQHFAIENAYRGPMPVSLEHYQHVVQSQGFRENQGNMETLWDSLKGILSDGMTDNSAPMALEVDPCIVVPQWPTNGSGRFIQLLGSHLGDAVAIPFAVEVDGEIIKVFDPVLHLPAESFPEPGSISQSWHPVLKTWDHRWVWCKRPILLVNGLVPERELEPVYEPDTDSYDAPVQIKANGGLFLLDAARGLEKGSQKWLSRWQQASKSQQENLVVAGKAVSRFPFASLPILLNYPWAAQGEMSRTRRDRDTRQLQASHTRTRQ